jgi:4-amino-4-deoxy-L-arabinose transferase-like glycosyltransferase
MNTEPDASRTRVFLLVASFLLLTVSAIWLPELSFEEALNATIARELLDQHDFITPHYQGSAILTPPMCAWILTTISETIGLGEGSIRIIGILPAALLALICALVVRPAAGNRAALAAAAAAGSCVAAMRCGVIAENDMLFALFINAAWICWYLLSREHKYWLYAWAAAHLLVVCALLTGGPKALFLFYFPLLILRRPLKIIRRLWQPAHLIPFTFLLIGGMLWILMVPTVMAEIANVFSEFTPDANPTGYVSRLIMFPVLALIAFLPWTFLTWPVFCVAFRPLEKNPVMCQYLRTIVYALFFAFWLIPGSDISVLLPLIGPLAILVGMNYGLLIRRYGRQLQWLPVGLAIIAFVGIIASLGRLVHLRLIDVNVPNAYAIISVVLLVTATVLATLVCSMRKKLPVWLLVIVSMVAIQFTNVGGLQVYDYLFNSEKREFAEIITVNLPPNVLVYELIPGNDVYPAECYYLDRPVIRLNSQKDLPLHEQQVYVIGRDRMPISSFHEWEQLSDTVLYKGMQLRVWKGVRR